MATPESIKKDPKDPKKSLNNQSKQTIKSPTFDYDKADEMAEQQAEKLWKKMGHLF